jgi:hypothetical protein
VNVNEFRAKFKSKLECYNFLSIQCECYLPDYETVTIYHLKDLISGKKVQIKNENVKNIHVPQYESLGLKKIFKMVIEGKP